MNKDQRLLEEAYSKIYEGNREPEYFGPEKDKEYWMLWLKKLNHQDGSVTVNTTVNFDDHANIEKRLPFNFRYVDGAFWCVNNVSLETLEGCPRRINGDFGWSHTKITSLKGAPDYVQGGFYVDHNKELATLEGAPEEVGRIFNCRSCNLSSLKGAPKIVGGKFVCYGNPLVSLEGCPEVIKEDFYSDGFTDKDYRAFAKKRKHVEAKLSKDLDVSALDDFGY